MVRGDVNEGDREKTLECDDDDALIDEVTVKMMAYKARILCRG